MNPPTKHYSAMLYEMADKMRNAEGCICAAYSPERIEEAAERLDTLTVVIRGLEIQHDIFPVAHRLALELECLLLSCTDAAAFTKWWDSANEALEQWREFCREDAGQGEHPEVTSAPAIVFYPAGSLGEAV